jgi:helix-turn-helix protein
MPQSFGARLRQRREEQAIALVTIAEQTKIKLSLLDALEHDDVSHWPSGIFRRAFIRAYAQAISLNPDVVVREFLDRYPDPHDVVADATSASSAEGAPMNDGPPTRFRYLVGSAFSRLRRSPTVDVLAASGGATTGASIEPTVDLPTAAPRSVPPGGTDLETEDVLATGSATAAPAEIDFPAVGDLCTEFARVHTASALQLLLGKAARILGATGIVVWVWDDVDGELKPVLAHGYSEKVLAQLPTVRRDSDNPTAAVFRSAQSSAIHGCHHVTGALVAPLMTPEGCAGVLAIELQQGSEHLRSVGAVATIIAAQLSVLIGYGQSAEAEPQGKVSAPPVEEFAMPILLAHGRH